MLAVLLAIGVALSVPALDTAVAQTKREPAAQGPHPVSEEVARQQLKIHGITNVERLERSGNSYLATGLLDGRRVELELNRMTGALRERGKTERLKAPHAMHQPPQLKIDQKQMVRPELMRGVDVAK